ncbi:MAG TPA: uroporphyrinogen-III C-methyltransferase [Myxococcaceae bacterium]|nr:uroporphyrinogen-III C-methyltransferase [Myxococcaceae bacterium]
MSSVDQGSRGLGKHRAWFTSSTARRGRGVTSDGPWSTPGWVSLVGAGPGSPDLLTLRAVRRLQEADLVLYDGLVPAAVLELAPRAHRFFVGKRVRRKAIEQEAIHRVMIRAARRGQRVVRLKCGDPFVLGRGGEEALALASAGVPFEVVPGISSAVAAPALAGIPVTHRGVASGFLVISGHAEAVYRPVLESLAPNAVTLVVLMGLSTRAKVSALLIDRGWRRDTPAAIALDASLPTATTWIGTLEQLGTARIPEQCIDAPGALCVGDVVSLAEQIRFSPLASRSPEEKVVELERSGRLTGSP